jgi:hypothetical protein
MTKSVKNWYLDHERVILLTTFAVAFGTMTVAAMNAQARLEAHRHFIREVINATPHE